MSTLAPSLLQVGIVDLLMANGAGSLTTMDGLSVMHIAVLNNAHNVVKRLARDKQVL